jgi:putative ABC transport system permease protein
MRNVRKLKPMAEVNFALNETSMLTKGFDSIFMVIGLAGWVIGGFSIIVGGFGIANIMFVSVKERTALIGIQKSLGAKNIFILTQFLTEAVILSLIGGVIGLLVVVGGLYIVNSLFDLGIVLTNSNIILALTISILIGVISGFIPSYTASQLDPVEAMRS